MNLAPTFTSIFEGNIWRILPDNTNQALVLEIRNYDTRTVSFSCIDLQNNKLVWHKFMLPESWWVGIEAVYKGLIFFHGYNHIQYANHLGITCVDIYSKTIIWEHKDLIFINLANDKIKAQRKKDSFSDNFISLDIKSGKIIEEYQTKVENPSITSNSAIYPTTYYENEEAFSKLLRFIDKKTGKKANQQVEYLELENFIIISFYTKIEDKLQNELILLDMNANIILESILDQKLDGIGIQTFFVTNRKLIYVQNKNELKVYDL